MDVLEYKEVKNLRIQPLRKVILLIKEKEKERPQTLSMFDVIINCHFLSNSISNITGI